MAVEINASSAICTKCGKAYTRRKGFFPVSYAILYKGIGFIPVCKDCIDSMYKSYFEQCGSKKDAVRQVCRKLDIFWSDSVFDLVDKKNTTHTLMTAYLSKITSVSYAGKSYDDTLIDEGALWSWNRNIKPVVKESKPAQQDTDIKIPESVMSFWGPGYTPKMYHELEERLKYWMSEFPEDYELDAGTKALLRQIVILEIDINRDRAAGKTVEKSVNSLNNLLGSAMLKPVQKKTEDIDTSVANTPLGVWLYKFENERPLPDVDDELKDVNGIKKYIFTWMGHLAKMLGIKNAYTRMYDEEIERLKVDRPEYDGDDEDLLIESYEDGDYYDQN